MKVTEFSTAGGEFSTPPCEFTPPGEEFAAPSPEYFPQAPELQPLPREFDQTAAPVAAEKKKKRRVTPLMLTAAAAVITVSTITPALHHSSNRREPYPDYPLSAERRVYVETLISDMRVREADSLFTLAADPTLLALIEEDLIPYYQHLEETYREPFFESFYNVETDSFSGDTATDRLSYYIWFDYDGNGAARFVGDGGEDSVQLDIFHSSCTLDSWYDGTQPESVTVQIIQQDIHHTYDYWLNVHYVGGEPYNWSQVMLPTWRESEDGQHMLAENGCIVAVKELGAAWLSRFETEGTFVCPRFDETGREIDYGMATIWLENGTCTVYDSPDYAEPSAVVTVQNGSVVLDDQVSLSSYETDSGTDQFFELTAASDGAFIASGTAASQEEFLYHCIRR